MDRVVRKHSGTEARFRGRGSAPRYNAGDEPETVWFDYPRTYESPATLDSIKLETGPLVAWSPSSNRRSATLRSLAAWLSSRRSSTALPGYG